MLSRIGSRLLVLIVALAACEAAIQVTARYSPYLRYQLSPPLLRNAVPDRSLGVRLSPYTPGHDRRGYRNQPPADGADRREIVAIGDSMTYGLGAFADGAWPQQLAQRTGRTVYNAGVGGYGPCEYSLVTEEMFGLEPKLVLVGLYVANDIGNAYASVYILRRCPGFGTDDPQVRRNLAAADSDVALSRLAAEYGDVAPPRPSALDGVATFALFRSVAYAIQTRDQLPNREGRADSFETAAALPLRVPMPEPAAFRTVFRDPRLDLLAINLDDPRMAEGLRVTVSAIRRIRDSAAARGAGTAVALLHSKPFVLSSVIGAQQEDFRTRFDSLIDWEARATMRLVDELNRLGIPNVDTGDDLKKAVAGGLMPFHPSDDTHPTAQGYGIISETIARALVR